MSEQQPNPLTQPTEPTEPDEMEGLKARAKIMGITFSNNISLETLRKRVSDKLAGVADEPAVNALTGDPEIAEVTTSFGQTAKLLSPNENAVSLRKLMQREQMKLVRVRITNMDPKKKDLPGEIFTVANEYLGTVRKFVPYGDQTDDGFHLPYCLYRLLDSKRFLHIRTIKDRATNHERQEGVWTREFSLDVLPPLTQDELNQLAAAQAAAG